jgi:hypothetical protein
MRNSAIGLISAFLILTLPLAQGNALTLRPVETGAAASSNLVEIRPALGHRGHHGHAGNHHSGYHDHGNWIWAVPAITL